MTDLCAPKLNQRRLTQLCSPFVGRVLLLHLFLEQTLNSDSASLHPDVEMGSGEFNAAVD